jgi:hypothetical protein
MHKVDNGRKDFRIDDVIPMCVEKLTPEEFRIKQSKIGIRSRQNSMLQKMVGRDVFAGESENGLPPEVGKALEALDAKLNYLIGVNMLNDASHSDMQERPVNLSVTGINFVARGAYAKGDRVKITLMLPLFPPSTLELLATLSRARNIGDGQVNIAAQFFYRCDDEEDMVSRYVYRRHREMIRICNRHEEIEAELSGPAGSPGSA